MAYAVWICGKSEKWVRRVSQTIWCIRKAAARIFIYYCHKGRTSPATPTPVCRGRGRYHCLIKSPKRAKSAFRDYQKVKNSTSWSYTGRDAHQKAVPRQHPTSGESPQQGWGTYNRILQHVEKLPTQVSSCSSVGEDTAYPHKIIVNRKICREERSQR